MRHFWTQVKALFLFYKVLKLGKFDGADFKNYNPGFFKILTKTLSNN